MLVMHLFYLFQKQLSMSILRRVAVIQVKVNIYSQHLRLSLVLASLVLVKFLTLGNIQQKF